MQSAPQAVEPQNGLDTSEETGFLVGSAEGAFAAVVPDVPVFTGRAILSDSSASAAFPADCMAKKNTARLRVVRITRICTRLKPQETSKSATASTNPADRAVQPTGS